MTAAGRGHSQRRQRVGHSLLPLDWGEITPLRLKARVLAEGVYAGGHRSTRRGAGIEFGGHRPYVPGDDLRFLDRRSLLRHDKLMVRQFETDTDRAIWLCLDASASMAFRGPEAPGAKLAYGALLTAALTRIAVAGSDPVGLAWLGGTRLADQRPGFGEATFERIVGTLETAAAGGELTVEPQLVERFVRNLANRARRGSAIVCFSDLLDLPDSARRSIASLASAGRAIVLVQVLDPVERDLGFRGKVRLRAIEGDQRVVTDADAVRAAYLERLAQHTQQWTEAIEAEGGRVVRACSTDSAINVLRSVLRAIEEARR